MSNAYLFSPLIILFIFILEGIFPFKKLAEKRMRHAANNVAIAGLDGVLNLAFMTLLTVPFASWIAGRNFGFLSSLLLPGWAKLACAFIFFDGWMYFWHRANHRIRWLWLLHRAHHNDTAMDTTTALRFHPLEILVSSVFNLGIIALIGMDMQEVILYNLTLQPIIFFHHSNVNLRENWDRAFRTFF